MDYSTAATLYEELSFVFTDFDCVVSTMLINIWFKRSRGACIHMPRQYPFICLLCSFINLHGCLSYGIRLSTCVYSR